MSQASIYYEKLNWKFLKLMVHKHKHCIRSIGWKQAQLYVPLLVVHHVLTTSLYSFGSYWFQHACWICEIFTLPFLILPSRCTKYTIPTLETRIWTNKNPSVSCSAWQLYARPSDCRVIFARVVRDCTLLLVLLIGSSCAIRDTFSPDRVTHGSECESTNFS